ncbi:MAG: branched-chain amino acid ABC transporter permease [Candidatus Methylomirabilales bacterium]
MQMMAADSFVAYMLNGLVQAACLFLLASGLTLIFGVLRILNFAHAALFMLAAYLAAQVTTSAGSFWAALLLVPPAMALVGAALERTLLRRVYDLPVPYQLLLTFGVILIIKDVIKLLWGTASKTLAEPPVLRGSAVVLGRDYPLYNLAYIALITLVAAGLWILLHRARVGKLVRAAAADREMASAMGINVPGVYTGVCAFGTALAGLLGVLHGPMMNIHLDVDHQYIVEAFAVVVIGGLGSVPGALAGSLLVGMLESFGILLIPRFQMAFIYMVMAAVLIVRPQGLFGPREG